jgi:hypothetical protein
MTRRAAVEVDESVLADENVEAFVDLTLSRKTFEETGDPLALLRILVLCDAFSVYPPLNVLGRLADAACKYLNANSTTSIDDLLGLSAKKRRKTAYDRRRSEALWRMMVLVWRDGVSDAEAARRVAADLGYKNPKTLANAFPEFRRVLEQDRNFAKRLERVAQSAVGVRRHRIR